LRIEEAMVLIDGALQFVFGYVEAHGTLPTDDKGHLDRMSRGAQTIKEVAEEGGPLIPRNLREFLPWLDQILVAGVQGVVRLSQVTTAAQRVARLSDEARALVNLVGNSPGGGPGSSGPVDVGGMGVVYSSPASSPSVFLAEARKLVLHSAETRVHIEHLVAEARKSAPAPTAARL
jgi:hypothetical protein